MDGQMNICVTVNSRYMRYLYIMLISLYSHHDRGAVRLWVVQRDFTEQDKETISKLTEAYGNTVEYIWMDERKFDGWADPGESTQNLSLEIYFRLLLPDILPTDIDRVLMLDADVIINKSLEELYWIDFEDKCLAAAGNIGSNMTVPYRYRKWYPQGRKNWTHYNTGVLLWNLKKFRNEYPAEYLFRIAFEKKSRIKAPTFEEEVFNVEFGEDNILELDASKWDYLSTWADRFSAPSFRRYKSNDEILENCHIIHYAAMNPWSAGRKNESFSLWWDYAKQSPFYQQILEECYAQAEECVRRFSQESLPEGRFDIDEKLIDLVVKYRIFDADKRLYDIYKPMIARMVFNEIMESIPGGAVIALRGNGEHTRKLLAVLSEKNRSRVAYIVDKQYGYQTEEGIPVIHPVEIEKYGVQYLILSSLRMREEFLLELRECMGRVHVIDPYEYLSEKLGTEFTEDFWLSDRPDEEKIHISVITVNAHIGLYESAISETMKKRYLEKVIAYCVEIRDFIAVDKYIDEYIGKGYDREGRFADFEKALDALWQEIEDMAKLDKRPHILINWVDNVNAEELYRTDYIKNREDELLIFDNAYTMSPWTHYTMLPMFCGLRPIQDKLCRKRVINRRTSPLLRELEEKGYQFKYVANAAMYRGLFAREYLLDYPAGSDIVWSGNNDRGQLEPASKLLWLSLKYRRLSHAPSCHLVHELCETHEICFYIGQETFKWYVGHVKGLAYVSKQLEWYHRFINEQAHVITLSDHCGGFNPYAKSKTNVGLVIESQNISGGHEQGFYSHIDFMAVIHELLGEKKCDFEKICKKYIVYENLDYMNEEAVMRLAVNAAIPALLNHKIPRLDENLLYQMKGVRTAEDMYVCFAEGEELYFRLPDEDTNRFGEERFKDRIEYLKSLCDFEFIDTGRGGECAYRGNTALRNVKKLIQTMDKGKE